MDIYVKTNSQAEKLAALLWMAKLTKKPICSNTLRDTQMNGHIKEYPFVAWRGDRVFGYAVSENPIKFADFIKCNSLDEVNKLLKSKLVLKIADRVKLIPEDERSVYQVVEVGIGSKSKIYGLLRDGIVCFDYQEDSLEGLAAGLLRLFPSVKLVK